MKKAIVIGATGTIGRAVVTALKNEGYEVVGASRSSQMKVDLENPATVDVFLKQTGKVDAVVCAAGNAAFAALSDLSEENFSYTLNSKLMGQVRLVQKALSYLNPGAVIILTGGIFAYNPWPGASAIAMVNAGLEGFTRGVATETTDGKRVVIVHPPLVDETAVAMGMDPAGCATAEEVALTYIQALKDAKNGSAYFTKGYHPVL